MRDIEQDRKRLQGILHDDCKRLQRLYMAEVERLRAELFEARNAILKEGMEADRLRAEVERLNRIIQEDHPEWVGSGD